MSDLRLSGWCSSAPGIRPDQHHDFCRWELCECENHANPVIHKGKVGSKRYNGSTNTDGPAGASTPVVPGLTDNGGRL